MIHKMQIKSLVPVTLRYRDETYSRGSTLIGQRPTFMYMNLCSEVPFTPLAASHHRRLAPGGVTFLPHRCVLVYQIQNTLSIKGKPDPQSIFFRWIVIRQIMQTPINRTQPTINRTEIDIFTTIFHIALKLAFYPL